jgi:hypothetical protein
MPFTANPLARAYVEIAMNHQLQPRKLVLVRETLRKLTAHELKLVVGGRVKPGTTLGDTCRA